MDSDNLLSDIGYFGSSGVILSSEQRSALQTSLILVRTQNKFQRVLFWGKIQCIKKDYFIAVGIGKDELRDRKYLFSQDCLEWGIMPQITTDLIKKAVLIRGRFTGDPAFDYERTITSYTQEASGVPDASQKVQLKEEERLAAVVAMIDRDTSLIPRGSFMLTPLGEIIQNKSFEGLSEGHSIKLYSYLHFQPTSVTDLPSDSDLDPSFDFLESLEKDIPQGCWALHAERGSGLVILKSLHWLGYTAFHVPNTPKFGSVYFGTGEKNYDLLFML